MIFQQKAFLIFIVCITASVLVSWAYLSIERKFNANYTQNQENRLFFLDGLRGIASVFVLANHSVYMFKSNEIKLENIKYSDYSMAGQFGAFGVQVFLCLTGFLFFSKIINQRDSLKIIPFINARVKRLFPAYIFSTIVVIALAFMITEKYSIYENINSILKMFSFGFFGNRVLINGWSTYTLRAEVWTLPYEWIFYGFILLIGVAYKVKTIKYPLILLALYVIFFKIDGWVIWPHFFTGLIAAIIVKNIRFIKELKDSYYCFSIILFVMVFISICFDSKIYTIDKYILASLVFLFVVTSRPKILNNKYLVFIGDYSYSLYLMHLPAFAIISRPLSKLIDLHKINEFEYFALIFITSIFSSVISIFVYKKIEMVLSKR
ncbi:acyltransferase family protein [Morganella morganii]|uniref:acyltransferase family protein n=1 Tax=Morganella morganii TaxID=582 RepID=UPI001BDAC744|nr:acyltransferase [Morganella morganii]MBT0521270.1 acyltransferase [Morganella morganii subsp. morganii]QWL90518.1 acyltransferase [Morganella morganii subsp. morganii]